jgi:hypothetical protein
MTLQPGDLSRRGRVARDEALGEPGDAEREAP